MRPRVTAATALVLALAALTAGCSGGGQSNENRVPGRDLHIYSSLPLQGVLAARAQDVHRGVQLALQQADGRVGRFRIALISLNDASAESGRWEPSRVSANARRAAKDDSTIAYIGELDSGASAISIPILNQAGILEVSPADGLAGLTSEAGATRGEPEKYYPDDPRNFGRVIPPDLVQARALVAYMKQLGANRLYILNDAGGYGVSLSANVRRAAAAAGVYVVADQSIVPKDRADYRGLARKVAETLRDPRAKPLDTEKKPRQAAAAPPPAPEPGRTAVLYAGRGRPAVASVWQALNAADPTLKLFGPNDLAANPAFYGAVGAAGQNTYLTDAVLAAQAAPPRARQFDAAFRRAYGKPPDPYAVYGYEAMAAVLQAIRNAGGNGNDRDRVIQAFFRLSRPASVLGNYRIDRFGDPTLNAYGGYRIAGGRLVFDRVLRPAAR
jgi:branched-chain amino acid transport system substrate-binding protein